MPKIANTMEYKGPRIGCNGTMFQGGCLATHLAMKREQEGEEEDD